VGNDLIRWDAMPVKPLQTPYRTGRLLPSGGRAVYRRRLGLGGR
jgi:hypothetical protein